MLICRQGAEEEDVDGELAVLERLNEAVMQKVKRTKARELHTNQVTVCRTASIPISKLLLE